MVLHRKPASGPACVANTLLVPVAPVEPSSCSVTVGSTVPTVTLPVHVPDANVTVVGLSDSVPAWPVPVSAAVPL